MDDAADSRIQSIEKSSVLDVERAKEYVRRVDALSLFKREVKVIFENDFLDVGQLQDGIDHLLLKARASVENLQPLEIFH